MLRDGKRKQVGVKLNLNEVRWRMKPSSLLCHTHMATRLRIFKGTKIKGIKSPEAMCEERFMLVDFGHVYVLCRRKK